MAVRKKTTRKKVTVEKETAVKKSLIGVDPLAFMSDDEMQALQPDDQPATNSAAATSETGADTDNDDALNSGTNEEILQESAGEETPQDIVNAQAPGQDSEQDPEPEPESEPDSDSPCVIDLGTSVDIRQAESLHKQLSELSGDRFVLDASAVSKVDACGLQLLTLFIQHAERECKPVEWVSPSEDLCYAAGLAGLREQLRLS